MAGAPAVRRPGGQAARKPRLLLEPEFPAELDFAQDARLRADGTLVVTRWSGAVHVLEADDRLRILRLPRLEPDGLHYTAVPVDGQVCATWCAGVSVVCAPLAP